MLTQGQLRLAFRAVFLGFCLVSAAAVKGDDLSGLVEAGKPERIASGLGFAEGPVWHPAGYLLFSDIPNSIIYKWAPRGTLEKFRSPSGKSNGLTVDRQGRLIACEHGNRRISRTEADGTITVLADRYEGKRLNSPNDVVVKSDQSIYFTDPPYGLPGYTPHPNQTEPGDMELSFSGVYRISPDGKNLILLTKDLSRPNGLAFSPDEKTFYVDDTERRLIYAFDVRQDGTLKNGRVFAEVAGYPDGMKIDARGNLYVATNSSAIQVFDSTGKALGFIMTDSPTANCAFGGPDNKTLFITAQNSVYAVRMRVPGARP